MAYPSVAVLVAFAAVVAGWGPEFFAAAFLVGAAAAFRRRRRHWWGLAGAAAGVVGAVTVAAGVVLSTLAPVTLAVFVAVVALRAAGHRRPARRAGLG
ncbi:MAG: hypothetical protein ACRDY0_09365 [Acidimicrobiales bacterium]